MKHAHYTYISLWSICMSNDVVFSILKSFTKLFCSCKVFISHDIVSLNVCPEMTTAQVTNILPNFVQRKKKELPDLGSTYKWVSSLALFWDIKPCNLVQCFRGTSYLHLQGRSDLSYPDDGQQFPTKCGHVSLHGNHILEHSNLDKQVQSTTYKYIIVQMTDLYESKNSIYFWNCHEVPNKICSSTLQYL